MQSSQVKNDMKRAGFDFQRFIRVLHAAVAVGLLMIASWGLLSANPLAPLKGTSFSLLRTIDDFLIHLSVYTFVTIGVASLFRDSSRTLRNWCVSAIIAHAIGTELLQALIPTRNCDPVDLVANLCGIMLGFRLLSLVHRFADDDVVPELQNALQ